VIRLIISIIATVLSITGNIFVNRKNRIGFIIWNIANVLWVYIAWVSRNYPQALMFLTYSFLNLEGWMKWKKN